MPVIAVGTPGPEAPVPPARDESKAAPEVKPEPPIEAPAAPAQPEPAPEPVAVVKAEETAPAAIQAVPAREREIEAHRQEESRLSNASEAALEHPIPVEKKRPPVIALLIAGVIAIVIVVYLVFLSKP